MIATAGASPQASQLAAGISTALFATLEGIALSIPAIFFHALFRNRIARLSLEVALAAEGLLEQFAPGVRSPHPLASSAVVSNGPPAPSGFGGGERRAGPDGSPRSSLLDPAIDPARGRTWIMAFRNRIRSSSAFELNLTPLLDVVLQLITFFMMLIHFGTKIEGASAAIRLPTTPAALPGGELGLDRLVVGVDAQGRLLADGESLDAAARPPGGSSRPGNARPARRR